MKGKAAGFGPFPAPADFMDVTSEDATYSVSQINRGIAAALRNAFPQAFWVAGEIQGYDRDAAKGPARRWGQIYFELLEKEEGSDTAKAAIKALVWGDAHRAILEKLKGTSDKLKLQDGLKVRFLCEVDFYWPRAGLQLKVTDVDPNFTLGDMERARQELLKALKERGLLDKNKAVPFPLVPQRIGLITSDGSAAYHDFMDELERSGYGFQVDFWDARMQGADTEESVCRGLVVLSARPGIETVVVIRGGGSRSDLIWFDKEKIAFAIAQCAKPVLTGIGHEIDLSVADLVAHAYQKTPTAVAQLLVERVRSFERAAQETSAAVMASAARRLVDERQRLSDGFKTWRYASHLLLKDARALLGAAAQSLRHGARGLQAERQRLAALPTLLRGQVLQRLRMGHERVSAARGAIGRLAVERIHRLEDRLASFSKECALKDPRRLLQRGYSLITRGGRLVKSVQDAAAGEEVEAVLKDGILQARVTGAREVVS